MKRGIGLVTYLLAGIGTYSVSAEDISANAVVDDATAVTEATVGVGESMVNGLTGIVEGVSEDVDNKKYFATPLSALDGVVETARETNDSVLVFLAETANLGTDLVEGVGNSVLTLGTTRAETNEYGTNASEARISDYVNLVDNARPNFNSPTLRPARDVWNVSYGTVTGLANAVVPNNATNPVDYALIPSRVAGVLFDTAGETGNAVLAIAFDANSAIESATKTATEALEDIIY